ncbi:hypothetical protein FPV67DRAFT_1445830 [Lyophyllum atratum]|nr:hypothetical protein FPV67DRAFT_1445830 [Lyophyllum atratum]
MHLCGSRDHGSAVLPPAASHPSVRVTRERLMFDEAQIRLGMQTRSMDPYCRGGGREIVPLAVELEGRALRATISRVIEHRCGTVSSCEPQRDLAGRVVRQSNTFLEGVIARSEHSNQAWCDLRRDVRAKVRRRTTPGRKGVEHSLKHSSDALERRGTSVELWVQRHSKCGYGCECTGAVSRDRNEGRTRACDQWANTLDMGRKVEHRAVRGTIDALVAHQKSGPLARSLGGRWNVRNIVRRRLVQWAYTEVVSRRPSPKSFAQMSGTLYAIGSQALSTFTSFDTLTEAETDVEMEEALRKVGGQVEKLWVWGAAFTASDTSTLSSSLHALTVLFHSIARALMALGPDTAFVPTRVAKETLGASVPFLVVVTLGSVFVGHVMAHMGVPKLRAIVFSSQRLNRDLSILCTIVIVANYSGALLCALA